MESKTLRELRKSRGKTQSQVALEIGVHPTLIGQLEKGKIGISKNMAELLTLYYGVEIKPRKKLEIVYDEEQNKNVILNEEVLEKEVVTIDNPEDKMRIECLEAQLKSKDESLQFTENINNKLAAENKRLRKRMEIIQLLMNAKVSIEIINKINNLLDEVQ